MTRRIIPQLVEISGEPLYNYDDSPDSFLGSDPEEVAELLGIDFEDAYLLTDRPLTGDDIAYLEDKYPEYMGVWPWLAKVGKTVIKGAASIGKKIASRVRARKNKKKKAQQQQAQASAAAMHKRMYEQAVLKKKADDKKKLMMMLPIAAIAAFMLLRK